MFFLFSLTGTPQAQTPREYPHLRNILVEGLNRADELRARRILALRPGTLLDPDTLEKIEENLRKAGFRPSRIRLLPVFVSGRLISGPGAPADLLLDFRPPPRIETIRVFPLIPADPILFEDPARVDEPFDIEIVRRKARAIREKAREIGYRELTITPFEDPVTTTSIALGFILEDDRPIHLRKVRFSGSGLFDLLNRAELVKRLENLKPEPFTKGTTVTASNLIETARFATAWYHENGFLDATVRLDETKVSRNGKKVSVRYHVSRGSAYKIAETRVIGAQNVPSDRLQQIADSYVGKKFTGARYREMGQEIETFCKVRGYMAPEVDLSFGTNQEEKAVAVLVQMDEGTTSTLGQVEIIHRPLKKPPKNPDSIFNRFRNWMSPPLQDEVIRRQVRTKPGQELNFWSLENPASRLRGLGCLEDVKVDTKPTTDTHVRDITVDVTDKRAGSIGVTAGWGTERGPIGMLQIRESNIAGVADRLSIQAAGSKDRFSLMFSYLDRNWKWGERFLGEEREPSLEHRFYWRESWFREYSESVLGATWELDYRRLSPRSWWRDAWRVRLDSVTLRPRQDRENYEERFDDYIAASLAYRLYRDTRNRADLSTRGTYFGTSLESGYADGFLLKWQSNFDWYYTFLQRLTWVTRAELGLMPYHADQVGIGERFQGGGVYDLRGFRSRGIGPVDAKEDRLHVGGATKTLLSNELRFAITKDIIPLVFCDVGSLDNNSFSFDYWNASAGGGIRFIIPGINNEIFLYYSTRLLERRTDETDNLQFGIRFAFR